MRKPSYDGAQERFIIMNCEDFTVKDLSAALDLTVAVIHNVGIKHALKFKAPTYYKDPAKKKETTPRSAPLARMVRPAAIYNQIASPYGIATTERIL